MQDIHSLLDGIGRGRIDRIVLAKLGVDVDLLAGIRELIKREGVRTGGDSIRHRSAEEGYFSEREDNVS